MLSMLQNSARFLLVFSLYPCFTSSRFEPRCETLARTRRSFCHDARRYFSSENTIKCMGSPCFSAKFSYFRLFHIVAFRATMREEGARFHLDLRLRICLFTVNKWYKKSRKCGLNKIISIKYIIALRSCNRDNGTAFGSSPCMGTDHWA